MNQYFLWLNGAQAGPYTLEEVGRMLGSRSISMQSLYWQEGMEEWAPLERDADMLFPQNAPTQTVQAPRALGMAPILISVGVILAMLGGIWALATMPNWAPDSFYALPFSFPELPPFWLLIPLAALYFLPTMIAAKSPWVGWIAILNLLFGWTIVVWLVCIIAAIAAPKTQARA